MVDINLIGDDKTEEEEQQQQEEFTQTTSMDTEELAFEERTETFDTTKTAGFARKRNYSSLVSTLIIFGVIVLLGGAIYFFMGGGTSNDDELARLEQEFAAELAEESAPADETPAPDPGLSTGSSFEEGQPVASNFPETTVADEPAEKTSEPTPLPVDRPVQRPRAPSTRPADTFSRETFSKSQATVQGVVSLMAAVPTNLNTTLLSFTGRSARVEFVASSASEARDFTEQLNQTLGKFSVVSESQISTNGQSMQKLLVTGRISGTGSSASGNLASYTLSQATDWLNRTARQFGVSVRELKPQPGTFVNGYQKVPLLGRLYGSQSAVLGLLKEISRQETNVEFSKILLVSPDMVTFSDDNLILVLNMYLYEQS